MGMCNVDSLLLTLSNQHLELTSAMFDACFVCYGCCCFLAARHVIGHVCHRHTQNRTHTHTDGWVDGMRLIGSVMSLLVCGPANRSFLIG